MSFYTEEGETGAAAAAESHVPESESQDVEEPQALENAEKDAAPDFEQELIDAKDQLTKLQGKFDRQGTELGELRKSSRYMHDNPERFLKQFAESKGISSTTEKTKTFDVKSFLGDEVGSEQKEQAFRDWQEKHDQELGTRLLNELQPGFRAIQEESLAKKYPSWDEDTDARELVQNKLVSGQLSKDELFQVAHVGLNLPHILADHEKDIRAKVEAELNKKYAGQIAATGGGNQGSKKPSDTVSAEAGVSGLADVM